MPDSNDFSKHAVITSFTVVLCGDGSYTLRHSHKPQSGYSQTSTSLLRDIVQNELTAMFEMNRKRHAIKTAIEGRKTPAR